MFKFKRKCTGWNYRYLNKQIIVLPGPVALLFFIGIKTLSTHIDGAGTGTSYPVPHNEAVDLKVLIWNYG